jgi:MprA protease rhombosortase-interaction domain-containing protein
MPSVRRPLATLAFGLAALAFAPAANASLIGPTAYTGFTGSPFDSVTFSTFELEDFEDGSLNTPGVTASAGGVLTFGSLRDSVESTPNGYSYYTFGATSLTFTFAGTLPTHAGIVWTDVGCLTGEACPPVGLGMGDVYFEAFDAGTVSLGVIGPSFLGDGAANGGTAEDRFFGATDAGGISKIVIWMPDSNDWEVDHLQYGVESVPEPSSAALLLSAGLAAFALRRRRS